MPLLIWPCSHGLDGDVVVFQVHLYQGASDLHGARLRERSRPSIELAPFAASRPGMMRPRRGSTRPTPDFRSGSGSSRPLPRCHTLSYRLPSRGTGARAWRSGTSTHLAAISLRDSSTTWGSCPIQWVAWQPRLDNRDVAGV